MWRLRKSFWFLMQARYKKEEEEEEKKSKTKNETGNV